MFREKSPKPFHFLCRGDIPTSVQSVLTSCVGFSCLNADAVGYPAELVGHKAPIDLPARMPGGL